MDLIFSNPTGLLALSAIPVVLLIHFFQQKSRPTRITTLFLLRHLSPESAQGISFEKLRPSWPLVLQILCVLLVAWVLAGPRWLRPASSQRVVMVLDSSLSMQAFREPLRMGVSGFFDRLKKTAAKLDIQMISTDLSQENIYRGDHPAEALAQIARWNPSRGSHDFSPALRVAQSLADQNTLIVFISDRPQDLPGGVEQIAVGSPLDNVGFLGASVFKKDGQTLWKAIVQNYTDKPVEKNWWIETGEGTLSTPQKISIAPKQFSMLSGVFPGDTAKFTLQMDEDSFPVDDHLPFVRPVSKKIKVWIDPQSKLFPFIQKFAQSIEGAEITGDAKDADLKIIAEKNPAATLPSGNAIIFLDEWSDNPPYLKGSIVEENQRILRDLNFQGLLVQGASAGFSPQDNDEVIIWAGSRPLIMLRESLNAEQLIVNFDPALSNASRLPSFILLLHRMVEGVRDRIIGFEQRNADAGQIIPLTFDPHAGKVTGKGMGLAIPEDISSSVATNQTIFMTTVRAPYFPKHAQIVQGPSNLLSVAAQFADTREADFSTAATQDTTTTRLPEIQKRTSREDFLTPAWILLILTALLTSWRLTGPQAPKGHPHTSPR